MDTEQSHEVLAETEMEKVTASKLETPYEFTDPEKLPAPVVEEAGKLAVNGHEAEKLLMKGNEMDASPPTLTLLSQTAAQVEPQDMSEQEKLFSLEKGAGKLAVLPNVLTEQAELAGPPKTIPDPVKASNSTEPENMQLERQPVVENTPEPLRKPLSADAPEPEPEKLVESVPEAAGLPEQTLREPVALLQPVGVEQHSKPEEVPKQAEKIVANVMDTLPAEIIKEVMAEKHAAEEELELEMEQKEAELKKEEERKMAELKKEEERKEAELQKEQERKMAEFEKEQEMKMAEFKKEQERKMAELQKEEERKEAELKKEQERKEAELKKEEERKMAELKKEEERKMAELKKEEERKMAELKKEEERKEEERKMAELKKEEERKEAELKKEQEEERKEAELKKEQERKEVELKKEQERKEAELKKEEERKIKEQERKEAELKKGEEVKAADLKQTEEKKEAELNGTEGQKEAELKETEEPKEAELKETEEQNMEEEEKDPTPGSLSFALLEQEQTKVSMQASRTLVVLRGLPGSGKSRVARAIADHFQDLCSVFCADDHGIKPENPEASTDGYKALDEAVVAHCSAQKTAPMVVVVDDTNHTQDRLARLGEIAEQQRLVVVFLEPRTEWSRDLSLLPKKTGRDLKEAQFEAMNGPFEETILPLFFGWFLTPTTQDKVKCTSMDFLKTLDTLDAFKKHSADFNMEAEKEVDLEQYFQSKGVLHCTTKFCDYGKAEGAKEYAEETAVKELYGSAFELSLSALFVTPRTVGARVSLSEEQLVLWPADAEKEVPAAASLPLGSRAHVTLGCANDVEPVQTGIDLLEILALQQDGQQGELVEEMELGSLAYYGNGKWLLSLREPISVQAIFSSLYHPKKADQTKKETEKKKKKCTIL